MPPGRSINRRKAARSSIDGARLAAGGDPIGLGAMGPGVIGGMNCRSAAICSGVHAPAAIGGIVIGGVGVVPVCHTPSPPTGSSGAVGVGVGGRGLVPSGAAASAMRGTAPRAARRVGRGAPPAGANPFMRPPPRRPSWAS
jgi:hypothetical protein